MAQVCPDTRWSWVEIDQGALRRNVRAFRGIINPRTRLMCVVKADAYGHGAAACARIMRASGADQFAVATVTEGVALREAGIAAPILVLSEPPRGAIAQILSNNLMVAIQSSDFALALGEAAASANKVAEYHLAIQTGMNRIGVQWDEACELRQALDFHRGLTCRGTFTHFATADIPQDWDFELQYKRFTDAVEAMREAGLDCGLVHCDNTPATILQPKTHLDMCRVGIGLYGLQASDATATRLDLEPVMSVRARVVHVRQPEVGEGVSYGMRYRVPKSNIQIGCIPIGYADGLSRTLSDRIEFLVRGQRVRQVGAICMDACMFANEVNPIRGVNPAKPVELGDVVTVIGSDDRHTITLDDHARLRGTINYEVACDFGMRLEKIYV